MKTALITGGSAGIGKQTALALAAQGYHVIIAARDAAKGQQVLAQIRAASPSAQVSFWQVDLSVPEQVRALAAHVRSQWDHIDALVLNAGLFTPALRTDATGHEFMFATTHLGHFLLTHHLLDLVKAAPAARVVVTSSVAVSTGSSAVLSAGRPPAATRQRPRPCGTTACGRWTSPLLASQIWWVSRRASTALEPGPSHCAHPPLKCQGTSL